MKMDGVSGVMTKPTDVQASWVQMHFDGELDLCLQSPKLGQGIRKFQADREL